ncbi:MAG: phosphoribosylaminoimidazolesuccinocarboxamide synthase [Planctomycetota bacterium]|nr:phosphoribosylaminoimidazolesuccinocarboxamide synthase [Planctomycetota bacterium]
MSNATAVFTTDLALPDRRGGKVRDVYTLDAQRLLVVATDRISAFDVVMPTPIAGKGALLTAMSLFWLRFIESRGICRTHLLSDDVSLVPHNAFTASTTREMLRGRAMIARRCRVIPIECVVRGYLEGSGWKEYQSAGAVCGVTLPSGLSQCARLPQPIFTPATKEEMGKHDENVSFERAAELVGRPLMTRLRDLSLAIYHAAAEHALARGIIIADTKFEFGIPLDGSGAADEPILIDEALTPDSSRFWPADNYAPGRPQQSYDKQYLREYLESLVAQGNWNKQAPGPHLPDAVVAATLAKYQAALTALTR